MTDPTAITVHLTREVYATLVRTAAGMGLTVTAYVARLLEIEAHDQQDIENIGAGFADAPERTDPWS